MAAAERCEIIDEPLVDRDREVLDTANAIAEGERKAATEAGQTLPVSVEKAPEFAATEAGKKAPRGSKAAIVLEMIMRLNGATKREICDAVGWKGCKVTAKRVAEKAGYDLAVVREGKDERLYAVTRAVSK